MKIGIKIRWLNLLLQNPEQQIEGILGRRMPDGTTYFCATGILLDNVGPEFGCTPHWDDDGFMRTPGDSADVLPDDFCEAIGLDVEDHDYITEMNDGDYNFEEIARWIEQYVSEDGDEK